MFAKHDIPDLDRKELRKFGLITGALFALIFGILFPWLAGVAWPWWPWAVAAVLWVWALVAPATLRPVYRGWMHVGMTIGGVVNRVVLGVVFYGLLLPMGTVMRLTGRDTMARRPDRSRRSYRVPSRSPERNDMEKPF